MNPTIIVTQSNPPRTIIWKQPTNYEALGSAVLVTGARLTDYYDAFERKHYKSEGWYNVRFQRPGEDTFDRQSICERRSFFRSTDEMEARCQCLLQALNDLKLSTYPDTCSFIPFERWSVTIACAAKPFLDYLESAIRNPAKSSDQCDVTFGMNILPALIGSLREFREVSTVLVVTDAAKQAFNICSFESFTANLGSFA